MSVAALSWRAVHCALFAVAGQLSVSDRAQMSAFVSSSLAGFAENPAWDWEAVDLLLQACGPEECLLRFVGYLLDW